MGQEFGFLIDLHGVQFDDSNVSWIQAFPLGTWHHPVYGEIKVTPEKVARMAANVNSNARGQELNIDYDHKVGEAAGWVKKAEARSNGLWLAVEWTKEAAQKIKSKAYRYFSPEYSDEWEDPRTKQTIKDVVFGGGITNRPFLKGILPLNLSEAFSTNDKVGGNLDPKKIRELLELSEDATDDDVTNKLSELAAMKKKGMPPAQIQSEPDDKKKLDDKKGDQGEPTIQVLAENNPVIKALMDEVTALKAANRLAEVDLALKSLNEGEGSFAIPPAILSEARTIAVEAPKALSDKVIALLSEIKKAGVVDLRVKGGNNPQKHSEGGSTAIKRFTDAVTAAQTERKLSYADAASVVAAEDPELFNEYRNETYVRDRG